MRRKGFYIAARLAGAVIVLFLTALLLMQSPMVQTRLTKAFIKKVESSIDGKVNLSRIELLPFRTLVIRDLVITDNHPYDDGRGLYSVADTFFYARQVSAAFSIKGLFRKEGVHIYRAVVKDGGMHLVSILDSTRSVNIKRIFGIKEKTDRTVKEQGRIFDIHRVRVENFRYRMNIYKSPKEYRGAGINFSDLDVTTSVSGHSMKMESGIMYAVCDRCELQEKSGYTAVVSGKCRVGRGKALIEDIHLTDPWSDIRLNFFSMGYDHGTDFKDFPHKIMLEGDFVPESRVALKSISFFGAPFDDNAITPLVHNGRVRGYLCDFRVEDFRFDDLHSSLSGKLDCRFTGLPDPKRFCIQVKGQNLRFTSRELSDFLSAWKKDGDVNIPELASGTRFTLNTNVSGPMNSLKVKALISDTSGTVDTDIRVKGISNSGGGIAISGSAGAKEIDFGRYIPGLPVGKSSFDAFLRTGFGDGSIEIAADSLRIGSLEFKDRELKNIYAKAYYNGNDASLKISSTDPEARLRLLADAAFDNNGKLSSLRADGNIARLGTSLLADSLSFESVSGKISADLTFHGDGGIRGKAGASSLRLHSKDTVYTLGDAGIKADYAAGKQNIVVKSDIFDASYAGSRPLKHFIRDTKAITLGRNFPALLKEPCHTDSCGDYRIKAELHHISKILPALGGGIFVADSTMLVSETGRDGIMSAELFSPKISFGNVNAYRFDLSLDNVENSLNAFLMADRIKAAGLEFDRVALNAFGTDDRFQADAQFNDREYSYGKLNAVGYLERNPQDGSLKVFVTPKSSELTISGENWKIAESEMTFGDGRIGINEFRIYSGDSFLLADGGISTTRKDTLDVELGDFALSSIEKVLKKDLGLDGKISGNANLIFDSENGNELNAILKVNDMKAGGVDAGDLDMEAVWDEEGMKYRTKILNSFEGRKAIDVKADIFPYEKTMEATAAFDKFNLALLAPFLKNVFSETGGSISGVLNASGPLNNLNISSSGTALDKAMVRVAFTGVPYFVNGPIEISDRRIRFNSLDIRDDSDGRAVLEGSLDLNGQGGPIMGADLTFRRLKIFDSTPKDNPDIYGLLRTSGAISINGPMGNLAINGNVATSGQGDIHVPLNSSLIGTSSDILTFVEKVKYYPDDEFEEGPEQKRRSGGLNVDLDLRVTQDVTAWLEINKSAGNAMKFNGNGDVDVILDPRQNGLNVNGLYSINNGNYHFALPGILEKDFNIQPGSSIRFNGAIPDSELEITAIHPVKTSLSTLLTDSTTVASRRLVECIIDIEGKIRNLGFGFDINVSDLDPSTKSRVESALNTEEKIQRQFVSLLLLGTFLPGEETGIINSSNVLYSNIGEIMSGQLNSILQKFNIPLDFGFGYQQSYTGTDMYDVAISTQLFDNRVIVNGSVGNKQYESGNGFAGDIDVEVKLDKSGRFRLNAFSHSADQYTSFLDNSQRSGVGFSYQREFNTFGEFFRNLFSGKKSREDIPQLPEKKYITIKVEP